MRVLDKRNFVNRLASQSQHVCIFKIQIFHVYKTLRSSAFSETQIGLPLFFSLENQNSANTIRNTSFIPSPMYISSSIFSVSLYSSMYVCYSILSISTGSLFSVPTSALFMVFVLHLTCQVTILYSSSAELML